MRNVDMDVAFCTEDGRTYTAHNFSQLPLGELTRKRRLLECTECRGPAFFRKASASGQAVCFGARPHEPDCSLRTAENELIGGLLGVDDEIFNPGDRIIIDLGGGTATNPRHVDDVDTNANGNGRGRRFIGDGERPDAVMHRRLRSLLRLLVTAPNFQYSTQMIEVANRPTLPAHDFFVPIGNVTRQYSGQYHGYWGMLSDAAFDNDGALWLNSGGRQNVSFCVPAEMVSEFFDRYGIADEEELAGAYILILGSVYVSMSNKLYCIVEDSSFIAARFS